MRAVAKERNAFLEEGVCRSGRHSAGMADPRKAYILRVASHLVSLNLNEEKLPNGQALARFCDSEEQNLVISRLDSVSEGSPWARRVQKGRVEVSNDPAGNGKFLYRVVFYKATRAPLSDEFKTELEVMTANHRRSDALLGTLGLVYPDLRPEVAQAPRNGENG